MIARHRWAIAVGIATLIVGYCAWLVVSDAPSYRFFVRLYVDKHFLKQTLREWGLLAPVIFIVLQALQVIIAPFLVRSPASSVDFSSVSGWGSSTPRSA